MQAALGRQFGQQIGDKARAAADFQHVVRGLDTGSPQYGGFHAAHGLGLLLQTLCLKTRVVERFELV
ncbi:hypothetical protein FQZ97_1270620 [compost metagenome]